MERFNYTASPCVRRAWTQIRERKKKRWAGRIRQFFEIPEETNGIL